MPLTDSQIRICLRYNLDPDLIDLVKDDEVYKVADLAKIFKCSFNAMLRTVEGIPRYPVGQTRGIRVKGSTFKAAIIGRLDTQKSPFN